MGSILPCVIAFLESKITREELEIRYPGESLAHSNKMQPFRDKRRKNKAAKLSRKRNRGK